MDIIHGHGPSNCNPGRAIARPDPGPVHGSHFHRAPGSIGASADPSHVRKGTKLPGHMGDQRVTIKNLRVVEVLPEENLLLIRGGVPGAVNGLLRITRA